MQKLKVNLSLLLDGGQPPKEKSREERRKESCERLKERVDYAIGLLDCNHHNKWMAVKFLQELFVKLDGVKRPLSEDYQAIKEEVRKAISDYGHYHLEGKD